MFTQMNFLPYDHQYRKCSRGTHQDHQSTPYHPHTTDQENPEEKHFLKPFHT